MLHAKPCPQPVGQQRCTGPPHASHRLLMHAAVPFSHSPAQHDWPTAPQSAWHIVPTQTREPEQTPSQHGCIRPPHATHVPAEHVAPAVHPPAPAEQHGSPSPPHAASGSAGTSIGAGVSSSRASNASVTSTTSGSVRSGGTKRSIMGTSASTTDGVSARASRTAPSADASARNRRKSSAQPVDTQAMASTGASTSRSHIRSKEESRTDRV